MADVHFEAPGAGMWDLDRSHYPGGTTPISQWLMQGCPNGMRNVFEEFGIPAETLDVRFVHRFMYTRLRPLIMPDNTATKSPPAALLKLAVRLHPGMRRRAKNAARALAERPWRKVATDWDTTIRPKLERENAALAEVDPASLDAPALADFVDRLLSYLRTNFEPEETPPPLEVLAPAHQMMVGAVRAVLVHLGMAGETRRAEGLKGCGIGTTAYRGRARVAEDPEVALEAMEPGDVLVVRFTTPAYNTVLAIAGAIVTADGALLSHAAVMARELGIPAVIGAPGALREIPDGAEIEVDPVEGVVRVLRPSSGPALPLG
jgi:phosphohistidine swiveling domain-containing protein